MVEPFQGAAAQVEAVQFVAAHVGVDAAAATRRRATVGHVDLAGQLQLEVDPLASEAGYRIGRAQPAGPVAEHGQAPVAGQRGEPGRGHEQAEALPVPEVGQRGHAVQLEGAQGRVQVVAVLGVVEA